MIEIQNVSKDEYFEFAQFETIEFQISQNFNF